MVRLIDIFISALINSFGITVVGFNFLDYDIKKIKKTNILIYLILFAVYLGISYLITSSFLKIAITMVVLLYINYKLFEIDLSKAIILSFLSLFLMLVSEILYAFIVTFVFNLNMEYIEKEFFGHIVSNITIVLLMILISKITFLKKKFLKLIKNSNSSESRLIITFSFITLISSTTLVYYIFFQKNLIWGFALCLILIVVYFLLSIALFSEKNINEKIKTEYELTLNSLSEYERLYSYQRMLNHEFKNDLMVIRGMAKPNNKKLLDYIDEIVDFKNNKCENWMNSLKKIPEGGLLGILYYKLLTMEQKKINVVFEIERTFKAKDYKKINDTVKNEICKLLGIYLDNAIQAVKNLSEKNVTIRLEEDNSYILFNISNNFKGCIDLSRINEKGYTTNETGRGYGLAIAKEIIEKDERIINTTRVIGAVFNQEIKIKM